MNCPTLVESAGCVEQDVCRWIGLYYHGIHNPTKIWHDGIFLSGKHVTAWRVRKSVSKQIYAWSRPTTPIKWRLRSCQVSPGYLIKWGLIIGPWPLTKRRNSPASHHGLATNPHVCIAYASLGESLGREPKKSKQSYLFTKAIFSHLTTADVL